MLHGIQKQAQAWLPAEAGPFRSAAEMALTALLAVQAASLFWTLASPTGPFGDHGRGLPDMTISAAGRPDPFFRTGERSELASAAAANGGALRLFGVRAGGAGGGSAIIAAADGRQVAYVLGEEVEPGLVLAAVADDHVTLARGSALSRLAFSSAAGDPQPSPPPPSTTAPQVVSPTTPPASLSVDPARLMAEAALTPRMRNGRIAGFTLQVRGAGDSVRAAGLRSGDVLLAVNDQPLDGPERLAGLRTALAQASSAEIRFERAGRIATTSVRILAR